MRATLELALLGPPQVRLVGQSVTDFKTLKAQALLYYLAVTGSVHMRGHLANLLWGGMPESRARINLSKSLSELRAVVGDHINIERQQVCFDVQSDYWMDLNDLKAGANILLAEAHSPVDDERLLRQLGETTDHYRGDFLQGFYIRDAPEFEMWVLAERGRQRELVVEVLHRLVKLSITHRRWRDGTGYARRLLHIEPWREATHRKLILLLARSGQRTAALAQFEVCRTVLAEELDVEPDPATLTLVKQIRTGEISREPQKNPPSVHEDTATAQRDLNFGVDTSPSPSFLDPEVEKIEEEAHVFVARGQELQELETHLSTALNGAGRVVFVTGEAGSGKTALLQAFTQRAMAAHPRLCVAHGIGNAYTGTGDPYLPFREIMSMLAGRVEDRWASGAISRDHARRLWHLLPTMVEIFLERGPNLIDTIVDGRRLLARADSYGLAATRLLDRLREQVARQHEQTVAQDRLCQQYGAVLQSLSSRYPLLLVLDDLHWADASSVALLFYLGRSIVQYPILVVSAYRPEDLVRTRESQPHPLLEVVGEFRRRFGEIEVSLDDRLEEDDRHFVNALLDSWPNRLDLSFRQSLFARSRGHPLFTLELLRDMQERQVLVQGTDGFWIQKSALAWDTLPARVEGVIERRMARLDPTLREILDVAAVEGEGFTAEVAARVLGLDGLYVVRRLATLDKTHRLVAPSGTEKVRTQRLSRYRFRHNLFQQYLYSSLHDVERAYLHERVGNELRHLFGGQTESIAVQLGRHFQTAGQTATAIDYWQQAGDAASRVYAHTEAVDSYSRGLELAKEGRLVEQLQRLFSRLGRALELNSQFDRALDIYMEMESMATGLDSRPMELHALMAQAVLYATYNPQHDLARGEAVSRRALDLAQAIKDEAAEAKILGNLIILYSYGYHWEEAIESGKRSIEIARRINLPEQLAQSLMELGGHCYEVSGQLAKAKEMLDEARDLWQEQENLNMLADTLATTAAIGVWEGDYERALLIGYEARRINQEIDSAWGQSYSLYKLGWIHWDRGRPDLALTTMEKSLQLARQSGFGVPQVITQADVAMLHSELGDNTHALEAAQMALDRAHIQGHLFLHYALGALAQVRIRQGQLDEAQMILARAELDDGPTSVLIWNAPALAARAMLALQQKSYARTVNEAQRLGCHAASAHRPTALLIEAQALLAQDERDSAYARLVEARTEAEAIGSRRTLWRILHLLGEITPEHPQAEEMQREAKKIVLSIAGHIPSADLRASFQSMPDMVQVLGRPYENQP